MSSVGSSIVSASPTAIPLALRSDPAQQTTPSTTISLFSASVPMNEIWSLRHLEANCRAYGYFEIFVDSTRVARSNSGPATENPKFEFDPYETAAAGQLVVVKYTQSFGPSMDVSAVLFVTTAPS